MCKRVSEDNLCNVQSMDDNCEEWVECIRMGMASGCGEQEAGVASGEWVVGGVYGCGWSLWVWLVGVDVRRYIDFLILYTYPYSSYICSFLQQHPCFLFILKCFSFLFQYFL